MIHSCVRCGKVFKSNISLDKHAVRCKKKRPTSVEGPNATRKRKCARHQTADEDDSLFTGHDLDDHDQVRTIMRFHTSYLTDHDCNMVGNFNWKIETSAEASQARSPPPPPTRSARSGRIIRIPRRFEDYLPRGDMSLDHVPPLVPPTMPIPIEGDGRSTCTTSIATPPDARPEPFQTRPNKLGIFRRYTHHPTWQPTGQEHLAFVCDSPLLNTPPPAQPEIIHEISFSAPKTFEPFTNHSTALFMKAYFSGLDTKSEEHANLLARVMEDKSFRTSELQNFSAQRENARLDKYIRAGGHPFKAHDGWHEATLEIPLPIEGRSLGSEDEAPRLSIPGFFHRRITDIIKSVCASHDAQTFHFTPYTMHWSPDPLNPDRNERIYGDTYMSEAMIQAQTEVENLPRLEGDTKERVVLGLMLASDCAQLTSFGSASVWPIYMMFANQPKEERARPSCHAVHHLAYAPSVSLC